MVSSISPQTQSLAYEMAQVSASSSLASSSKIERLSYNGLSETEKESLRQKYSAALEEYNLDDLDLYEEIEGLEEEGEEYLDLSLDTGDESDEVSSYRKDVSSKEPNPSSMNNDSKLIPPVLLLITSVRANAKLIEAINVSPPDRLEQGRFFPV